MNYALLSCALTLIAVGIVIGYEQALAKIKRRLANTEARLADTESRLMKSESSLAKVSDATIKHSEINHVLRVRTLHQNIAVQQARRIMTGTQREAFDQADRDAMLTEFATVAEAMLNRGQVPDSVFGPLQLLCARARNIIKKAPAIASPTSP